MHLTVVGVLTDYKGRVLLQQPESRALIPIHRPCKVGALPTDTLAEAIRQATGLIALPVRLTGLDYRKQPGGDELAFYYRCTLRGGDLSPPNGQPPAGFFDSSPLPRALSPRFSEPLAATLSHAGGPPFLAHAGGSAGRWLRRLYGGQAPAAGVEQWAVTVRVTARRPDGQVLWTRQTPGVAWGLPATTGVAGEAPWETAARLLRAVSPRPKAAPNLQAVAIAADRPAATLFFDVLLGVDETPTLGEMFTLASVAQAQEPAFDPVDARLLSLINDAAAPTFHTFEE
jgi:hypothetical protein